MAQSNKLIASLCLTWNTVCPDWGSSNTSDDFLVLGAKYNLLLGRNLLHREFESFIVLVRATITPTPENFLHRTFSVRTIIEHGNTGTLILYTPYHATFEATERNTIILRCFETDMPEQYVKPRLPWRVTCIFEGIDVTAYQPLDQTSSPSQLNLKSDFESLSSDLSKMLENEASTDVKLRSGGSVFSAHKAVLSARSEVFAAMFRNKMLEMETGTVDIKDVEAPVLEHLLKYMYSGKIEVAPDDVIPGLYESGDKYAVLALKRACSERMLGNLTEENCLDTFILFDAHNDESSKAILVDFIVKNESVFQSEAWHNFRKNNPILAVEVYQKYVEKNIFSKKHQNI